MRKITYNNKINKNKRHRKYNGIRFMFIKIVVDFLEEAKSKIENESLIINKENIVFKINSILTSLKNSVYENDIYYEDFMSIYTIWFNQIELYKNADDNKENVLYSIIDKIYVTACYSCIQR